MERPRQLILYLLSIVLAVATAALMIHQAAGGLYAWQHNETTVETNLSSTGPVEFSLTSSTIRDGSERVFNPESLDRLSELNYTMQYDAGNITVRSYYDQQTETEPLTVEYDGRVHDGGAAAFLTGYNTVIESFVQWMAPIGLIFVLGLIVVYFKDSF